MTESPPESFLLARREAFRTACAERMPMDSMALPPLPVIGADPPTLGFPMSLWDHGRPALVTRPWVTVDVSLDADMAAITAAITADFHDEPGAQDWLCRFRSDPALGLVPAARRRIENEYAELVVTLAGEEPAPESARRLAEIFAFLVPPELHDWYRRTNPACMSLMEEALGAPLAPRADPPDWIELPDAPVGWLLDLMPSGDRDRLVTPGGLGHALSHFDLRPDARSPLAGLDLQPAGADGDVGSDFPSDRWRAALAALCRPAFLVEVTGSDGEAWARVSTYAGSADGSADRSADDDSADDDSWVVHDHDGFVHLLSFPRRPEETLALVDSYLPGTDPPVQGDRLELSRSECIALFRLADGRRDGDTGPAEGPPPPGTESVVWTDIAALLTPVEVAAPEHGQGIEGLADAGWIIPADDRIQLTPEGSAVLDALGSPIAAVALRAVAAPDDDGCVSANGIVAVSTPDRLWLGGVAQEWDCESPPDDPRVVLVAVRPDEVLRSAANVLDLR